MLMSLDDRVLHLCGPVHGVALCGEPMRDTWKAGTLDALVMQADAVCDECNERAQP